VVIYFLNLKNLQMKKKILLLLILMATYSELVFTQPIIKNQKVTGGDSTDIFTCMDLTRDGGMIIGSTSYSGISGQKTDSVRGGEFTDYWIVKLGKKGNIEWDKTIGGNGIDELKSIRQTPDGGYILGGRSASGISGEKTVTGSAWVVKLDHAGNIEWDKTYSGYRPEDYFVYGLQALELTRDGGYIMNILIISNDPYDSPIWVVKTDSLGNIQWDDVAVGGETPSTSPSAVIQTSDSGYLIGYTNYDHTREVFYYGVSRIDKNGNLRWSKTYYNQDAWSFLHTLLEKANGNFILAGSSEGYAGPYKSEDGRGDGSRDYWLLTTDSLGNYISDKNIGGEYSDELMSIAQTKDKGLILGGYSLSNASYEKSENNRGGGGRYDADYWVVKLDSLGEIEWDKTIGGDTTDMLIRIREGKRNQYILGGYSYSGISGDKTKPSRGGADYWLVCLQYNTVLKNSIRANQNIAAAVLNKKSFTVFPNPVKNILYVQSNGNAIFTLTDQSGKIILTKTINGNGEIYVSHLPAGLYYLKNHVTGAMQSVMVTK
jgi:hypothetical protein